MKVYVDNTAETMTFVQSIASASTLISSLAAEARQYIISKFPKDYFKHIYIDTSETVAQQSYNDHYNRNANKIPYPSLSITPEISLDDPIGGLEKSLHLSSPNLYLRKDIERTYKKLVVDPDSDYAIYYTSDYITTNFNFKIITNSFIRNTDIAFYLKSKFQNGFFQYLNNKNIQSEIPKTFIRVIADLKDWDLDNENDMTSLRLYLMGSTLGSQNIEKKKNLTTGKMCFFLQDKTNLLTLFTDLDCPSSIIRDNQTESEYIITFRFQVSTWIPNAFIMKFNKKNSHRLSKITYDALVSGGEELESGFLTSSMNTEDTVEPFGKLYKENAIGKTLTKYFIDNNGVEQIGQLKFDSGVLTRNVNKELTTYDTLGEMTRIFDRDYREFTKVLSYMYENNIDVSSLVYIDIRYKSGSLPNSYYQVDPKSLKITFSKNVDSDIKVILYVNKLLYKSLLKAMKDDKNYFNNNYLTSVFAKIAGENVKLIVKSFPSNSDFSISDINKSLRVSTPYGIGYISLLEETEKNIEKDNYKVCVGHNSDGTPIIKILETKK